MKPKVIITGHDLGYSKSVNDGYSFILNKLPKFFSELSILPNALYSKQAVDVAINSGISTNLCISLSNSKLTSLSKSKSLTDNSNHLKNADTIDWNFSVIDSYNPLDIKNEINAQYEWFLDNFKHKPSALVTQKGEHGDPKILEPLIDLAKKENLPMRAPLWQWKANYGAQSLVESEGIKTTNNIFIGLKDWRGKFGFDLETNMDELITAIKQKEGVSELIILAGFCDQELFDMTSISWQRGQILNILKRKYNIVERLYYEFDIISYKDI